MSKLSEELSATDAECEAEGRGVTKRELRDWAAQAEALEAEVERLRKELVKADRTWLQGENERDALRAVIEKVRMVVVDMGLNGTAAYRRWEPMLTAILNGDDIAKEVPANGNV